MVDSDIQALSRDLSKTMTDGFDKVHTKLDDHIKEDQKTAISVKVLEEKAKNGPSAKTIGLLVTTLVTALAGAGVYQGQQTQAVVEKADRISKKDLEIKLLQSQLDKATIEAELATRTAVVSKSLSDMLKAKRANRVVEEKAQAVAVVVDRRLEAP